MKSVFEPLNALLFVCMALITLVFKPTVTQTIFKPVVNSKRSLLVKLRFLSKWFTKQVPYFAPFVLSVSGLVYMLSGGVGLCFRAQPTLSFDVTRRLGSSRAYQAG